MEAQTEVTIGQLNAVSRTVTGKNNNRKLRTTGKIPSVIYGQGKSADMIAIDPSELEKALDPGKRRNTFLTLKVADPEGTITEEKVMIKDFQIDPLKDLLLHVDFIRVTPETKIVAKVPLRIEGRCLGEVLGGRVRQIYRELEVEATPATLPTAFTVDVTPMNLGDVFAVKELTQFEGVRLLLDGEKTIVVVSQPKGSDDAATDEEETEEETEAASEE